ncbi:hypothetical protein D3C75_1159090 [compost metagenome]
MHHLKQNAEEHRATEVAVVFKQGPAALFYFQAFTNFFKFTFCFGTGITQTQQDALGIVETAFSGEPARAVWQEENANQKNQGWNSNDAEHPAP